MKLVTEKKLYVQNVGLMFNGKNVGTVTRGEVTMIAEKILVAVEIHGLMYPVTSVMVKVDGGSVLIASQLLHYLQP